MGKHAFARILAHLAILALLTLYMLPIAWMLSTSLKPDDELFTEQIRWIPNRIAWENYQHALATFPFWLYLRNTLLIAGLTVVGTLLSCLPPARAQLLVLGDAQHADAAPAGHTAARVFAVS
jgi:ABC-type glycerol-3-phosphate transport system permease component